MVDWPGHIGYGVDSGTKNPDPSCKEGYHRVTGECGWVSAVGGLYQTIAALNGPYIVSGWIASWCDGGDEVIEIVAMDGPYTGGVPSGVTIGRLTSMSNWVRVTNVIDVTSGQLTVALRTSQWSARDIVSGHFDGINVIPATRGSIGSIKRLACGAGVITDTPQVVSAVIDANTFYIQSEDRSSGIKVVTPDANGTAVGDRVIVCGTLAINSGEAQIEEASILTRTTGEQPAPVAIRLDALGGTASGIQPTVGSGLGPSNIGLLVRTWGIVQSVDPSGFVLTDVTGTTVRCVLPNANAILSPGNYAACTGISSCEIVGEQNTPVIRLRDLSDLTTFRQSD